MEKLKRCSMCGSTKLILLDEEQQQYKCHACLKTFTMNAKRTACPAASVDGFSVTKRRSFFDNLMTATVELHSYFDADIAAGTGFFISSTYLLTNAHVVTNCEGNGGTVESAIMVVGSNYEKDRRFIFDTVAYDLELDIAILKLQEGSNGFVTMSREIFNGDRVYAIGNARGEGLCIVDGIVSDVARTVGSNRYFMTSAIVTNGNSGCPVFGSNGTLLGMITAGSRESVAMNYAIPSSILEEYIKKVEGSKQITIL